MTKLYVKDPSESKYQLLINELIYYSKTIDDVYENLEDYNPKKKRRVLIVFDGMIVEMESDKRLSPIVKSSSFKRRKLNISLVFISQSYFKAPKTIRINAAN